MHNIVFIARPTACSDHSIQFVQQVKVNNTLGVSYYGVVKICINKQWGYICSNGWDYIDAKVACIDLGFSPYGKHIIFILIEFI